ncbi:hypothetical protein MKX01_022629 [Papaver californicum]|nr:hypothetical protein MKX01_022629 [Papaver californicum]
MRNTKNNSVLEVEDKSTEMTEIGVEERGEVIQSVSGSAGRRGGMNKYVSGTSLLASTNSLLLGYGSLNVCLIIGSILSGKTSDWIGRRYTIVLAALTFLIGALLMGFAPSYPFLLAGRVVAGIGVGYSLMVSPVYTAELSPAATRGFLSSLPEAFITVGILVGYISNYALPGIQPKINWRIMLGIAVFPAFAIGIGVLTMPESPRWLVMKGRIDEARQVLRRTSSGEEEAEFRLQEISKDISGGSGSGSSKWKGQGAWRELLFKPSRPIRRILIAAIGINFFMQASGNDAVIYYTPQVFKAAGIKKKKQLIGVIVIMGIAKSGFVLISAAFLDRFGRRPLLLLGTLGMTISLADLCVGSMYLAGATTKPVWAIALCVVAVCADVSFFSIGLGPITWVYSSKIFPNRLRAQGTSIAVSVNRLVSGAVSMTLGTLFFYLYLPEPRGRIWRILGALFED